MKDKLKKVKRPASALKPKKKKLGERKEKVELQTMSVDDFMSGFVNEESSDNTKSASSLKKSRLKNSESKSVDRKSGGGSKDTEDEVDDDEDEEDVDDDEFRTHRNQLDGLKKSDPEFYKYLEEHDQELLNFDDSDAEDDDDDERNEKFHKAPDTLQVASDESDFEVDEEVQKSRKGNTNAVTPKMVTEWQKKLAKGNIAVLREAGLAFHAALVSISAQEDATSPYVVEGAVTFNSVIRMCVVDFLPAVQKALRIPIGLKVHPKTSKSWDRVKPILRAYFTDLAELSNVSSPDMLTVLLKHIHQMSPLIACFPSIAPKFLKRVVQLWATDEDVVRVLAFLCALRLGQLRQSLLRHALKIMHLTYVRNTKFVSPSTLPGINFMRQSLCEMLALDTTISYHMAFLCIRQLAVHLRNAVTLKKKVTESSVQDSYKSVYNWAYVSSLRLWADLLGIVSRDSPLRSLTYPLVQIIIGTIKLIPSAQYFPLRFHCIRILINVGSKCGVFIPVLPFVLEVLTEFNFNREHKKLSMRPLDLTCLLRCSKSQMKENGFKDAVIENVQDLLVEYLATECHRLSFPDVTVPCIIEIKSFLKTCNVANFNKKLKAVLDKLTENSRFIEEERKKLNLRLDDPNGVEAAETAIRLKQPPFLRYHESWRKVHLQQQARKVTNNQKVADFKLPVLYKLEKKRSRIDGKTAAGPPELFPSDDEEDSDDGGKILKDDEEDGGGKEGAEEEPPKKRKKQKREQEEVERKPEKVTEDAADDIADDAGDIIEDLKYSDFA